jgi:hypothetical protein
MGYKASAFDGQPSCPRFWAFRAPGLIRSKSGPASELWIESGEPPLQSHVGGAPAGLPSRSGASQQRRLGAFLPKFSLPCSFRDDGNRRPLRTFRSHKRSRFLSIRDRSGPEPRTRQSEARGRGVRQESTDEQAAFSRRFRISRASQRASDRLPARALRSGISRDRSQPEDKTPEARPVKPSPFATTKPLY